MVSYRGGLGDKTEKVSWALRVRGWACVLRFQFHPVGSATGLVLGEGRLFWLDNLWVSGILLKVAVWRIDQNWERLRQQSHWEVMGVHLRTLKKPQRWGLRLPSSQKYGISPEDLDSALLISQNRQMPTRSDLRGGHWPTGQMLLISLVLELKPCWEGKEWDQRPPKLCVVSLSCYIIKLLLGKEKYSSSFPL